jgi:hypothetical protein
MTLNPVKHSNCYTSLEKTEGKKRVTTTWSMKKPRLLECMFPPTRNIREEIRKSCEGPETEGRDYLLGLIYDLIKAQIYPPSLSRHIPVLAKTGKKSLCKILEYVFSPLSFQTKDFPLKYGSGPNGWPTKEEEKRSRDPKTDTIYMVNWHRFLPTICSGMFFAPYPLLHKILSNLVDRRLIDIGSVSIDELSLRDICVLLREFFGLTTEQTNQNINATAIKSALTQDHINMFEQIRSALNVSVPKLPPAHEISLDYLKKTPNVQDLLYKTSPGYIDKWRTSPSQCWPPRGSMPTKLSTLSATSTPVASRRRGKRYREESPTTPLVKPLSPLPSTPSTPPWSQRTPSREAREEKQSPPRLPRPPSLFLTSPQTFAPESTPRQTPSQEIKTKEIQPRIRTLSSTFHVSTPFIPITTTRSTPSIPPRTLPLSTPTQKIQVELPTRPLHQPFKIQTIPTAEEMQQLNDIMKYQCKYLLKDVQEIKTDITVTNVNITPSEVQMSAFIFPFNENISSLKQMEKKQFNATLVIECLVSNETIELRVVVRTSGLSTHNILHLQIHWIHEKQVDVRKNIVWWKGLLQLCK